MWAFGANHSALLHGQQLYTAGDNLFAQLLRAPGEGMKNTGKIVSTVACSKYSTYLVMADGVYRSGPYRQIVCEAVSDFVATEEFYAYLTLRGEYRDSNNNQVPGTYQQLKLKETHLAALSKGIVTILAPTVTTIPLSNVDSYDVTVDGVWLVANGQCYRYQKGNLVRYFFPAEVVEVACGISHVLVLLETGDVWSSGSDQWGQLGTGQLVDGTRETFALVGGLPSIKRIFASEDMSAVLTTTG